MNIKNSSPFWLKRSCGMLKNMFFSSLFPGWSFLVSFRVLCFISNNLILVSNVKLWSFRFCCSSKVGYVEHSNITLLLVRPSFTFTFASFCWSKLTPRRRSKEEKALSAIRHYTKSYKIEMRWLLFF